MIPETDATEPSKRCTRCGEKKALDAFVANKGRPDGRGSWCKACNAAHVRQYYMEHPEKGRERARVYYATHSEYTRAHNLAYYKSHKEAASATKRAHYLAHRGEYNARAKAWREANLERLKATQKAWLKDNPERARAARQLRRARKAGAPVVEYFTRREIYDRDNGRCHACGKKCRLDSYHVDHLVPLARGGAHARWNVAVAHPRCNLSRGIAGPAQLLLPLGTDVDSPAT